MPPLTITTNDTPASVRGLLEAGRLSISFFTTGKTIGAAQEGGMLTASYASVVYAPANDKPLVIKAYRAAQLPEEVVGRLIRTIAFAGRIPRHPRIQPVYGAWEEPGYLMVLQPHADGGDLAKEIQRRRGIFSDEDVGRICGGVLEALAHIHSQGHAHLNVKPNNVLLDRAGRPLLADLGLGRPPVVPTHSSPLATRSVHFDPVMTSLEKGTAQDLLAVAKIAYTMAHRGKDGPDLGTAWESHPLEFLFDTSMLLRSMSHRCSDFIKSAMAAEMTARRLLEHPLITGTGPIPWLLHQDSGLQDEDEAVLDALLKRGRGLSRKNSGASVSSADSALTGGAAGPAAPAPAAYAPPAPPLAASPVHAHTRASAANAKAAAAGAAADDVQAQGSVRSDKKAKMLAASRKQVTFKDLDDVIIRDSSGSSLMDLAPPATPGSDDVSPHSAALAPALAAPARTPEPPSSSPTSRAFPRSNIAKARSGPVAPRNAPNMATLMAKVRRASMDSQASESDAASDSVRDAAPLMPQRTLSVPTAGGTFNYSLAEMHTYSDISASASARSAKEAPRGAAGAAQNLANESGNLSVLPRSNSTPLSSLTPKAAPLIVSTRAPGSGPSPSNPVPTTSPYGIQHSPPSRSQAQIDEILESAARSIVSSIAVVAPPITTAASGAGGTGGGRSTTAALSPIAELQKKMLQNAATVQAQAQRRLGSSKVLPVGPLKTHSFSAVAIGQSAAQAAANGKGSEKLPIAVPRTISRRHSLEIAPTTTAGGGGGGGVGGAAAGSPPSAADVRRAPKDVGGTVAQGVLRQQPSGPGPAARFGMLRATEPEAPLVPPPRAQSIISHLSGTLNSPGASRTASHTKATSQRTGPAHVPGQGAPHMAPRVAPAPPPMPSIASDMGSVLGSMDLAAGTAGPSQGKGKGPDLRSRLLGFFYGGTRTNPK